MAIDVNNIQDFSYADLLKAYKWALMNSAAGQSRTIENKTVTFPSAKEMLSIIIILEALVGEETNGGNIALVEFGEAQ